MPDQQKTQPRLLNTQLSALTRVQWSGNVLADPSITDADNGDLTDVMYEHVDGGEFVDDEHFWDRGESCETVELEPAPDNSKPVVVAYKDEDGTIWVADVPEGEDPAEFLEKYKKGETPE